VVGEGKVLRRASPEDEEAGVLERSDIMTSSRRRRACFGEVGGSSSISTTTCERLRGHDLGRLELVSVVGEPLDPDT